MIPAEYILMKKLGKHYLIDSYENNLQKDNKIKKNVCFWLAIKKGRTQSTQKKNGDYFEILKIRK